MFDCYDSEVFDRLHVHESLGGRPDASVRPGRERRRCDGAGDPKAPKAGGRRAVDNISFLGDRFHQLCPWVLS